MHDGIKDDIKAIRESQAKTEIDIAVIKTDIGHHIKRTDMLQHLVTVLILAVVGGAIRLMF